MIIRHPLDTVQCLVDLLYGISAHIVVVYEVGGGGDIDGGGSGIGNAKLLGEMCNLTVALHLDAAFGFQSGLDAFMILAIDNGSQFVYLHILAFKYIRYLRFQLRVEVHVELQSSFLARLDTNDDHIIGLRSKDGTFISHAVNLIGSGIQGIGQVQFSAVVRGLSLVRVFEGEFYAT